MQILVDSIPKRHRIRYIKKGPIYYGELEGYVHFIYYERPGEGFGGAEYKMHMQDGSVKVLKGPWSSSASTVNGLGLGPCADVSMTDDPKVFKRGYTYLARSITMPLMEEAAKLAGVHLVKYCYTKPSVVTSELGGDQKHAVHMGGRGQVELPYWAAHPPKSQWLAVPSMDSEKITKPPKDGD
jgi:hypothetical protein